MTVPITPSEVPAPASTDDSASAEAARLPRWLVTWRMALRLGRRETTRHRSRSALVVAMVGLPVLLLVAGACLWGTATIDAREQLPYAMGQGQARLTHYDQQIAPGVWPPSPVGYLGPAPPIPGWGPTPTEQAAAVQRLTGGTVIPIVETRTMVAAPDGRVVDATVLGVDAGARPMLEGLVHLRSGRWPSGPDEVVVTPVGQHRGLPDSGTVRVTDRDGQELTRRVVGVADGYLLRWEVQAAELIGQPTLANTGQSAFVLDRTEPVTWSEVQRLAAYGLLAHSRAVILDPPALTDHDLAWGGTPAPHPAELLLAAIVSVGLMLETALLVAPAFAVSAARRRRTLALLESTGATMAQVRRVVLGQALVLGVLAVLVGAPLGVAAGYAAVRAARAGDPGVLIGPFGVAPGLLAIIVASAIGATAVAALVPARGLARLDVIALLAGRDTSPPMRWHSPVAGLVVSGLGALALFGSVQAGSGSTVWDWPAAVLAGIGVLALLGGVLALTPALLVALAKAGREAPAIWRIALRDTARHRGRATATVGAVVGAAALTGAVLVAATSTTEVERARYAPAAPLGVGVLTPRLALTWDGEVGPDRTSAVVRQVLASAAPRLSAGAVYELGAASGPSTGGPPEDRLVVAAVRHGCTPEQALAFGPTDPVAPLDRCLSVTNTRFGDFGGIIAGDPEILVATYGLDQEQAETLRAGGALVNADPPTPTKSIVSYGDPRHPPEPVRCCQVDLVGDQLTLALGQASYRAGGVREVRTVQVPARGVPAEVLRRGAPDKSTGILVTVTTARSWGVPVHVRHLLVTGPDSASVTEAEETAILAALTPTALAGFRVERGFQAYDTVVALVGLGVLVLIALTATLLTTALSLAEARPFHATLAAIGATRRTRRGLAAAQAGLLGLIGTVLGLGMGIAFGAAVFRAEYESLPMFDDPTWVVVPWVRLAVPVALVPLLTAAIAWVAVREAPRVTRRRT